MAQQQSPVAPKQIAFRPGTFTTGDQVTIAADGTLQDGGTPGSGGVSISLTMPAEFSVAGSPAGPTGTFAVTKANESAHTFWAAPIGGSGQPIFRIIDLTDLPAITFPLVVGFIMGTGATGNNVGPELVSPRAATVSKCKVVTKSSDGSVALSFRIMKNGTNVFSSNPSVAAGTVTGTVSTFTSLTSTPLNVLADDTFTVDILTGSSNWSATIQLET